MHRICNFASLAQLASIILNIFKRCCDKYIYNNDSIFRVLLTYLLWQTWLLFVSIYLVKCTLIITFIITEIIMAELFLDVIGCFRQTHFNQQ